MANLAEVSQWENVIRQIENGEAATGGADGLANIQAKQLANRTKWLKENCLPLTGGELTGNALTWNGNDLAGSAIVAKSLNQDGYIKYASGLIIQWGIHYFPSGAQITKGSLECMFPISFSKKTLGVVACHTADSGTNQATVTVQRIANNQIALDKFTASLEITPKSTPVNVIYGGVSFIAIGY